MTSFECPNSVFNITNKNKSFSISIPGYWNSEDGDELINKLNSLLELRSENDIKSHVKEIDKSGNRREIEKSGYNLAGFDHFNVKLFQN